MRRTTALLSAGALALAGALIAAPASAEPGDLKLDRDSVILGANVTVTATLAGCAEYTVGGIALFAPGVDVENDEADPIAEADDIDINADGELVGTFTVPADAAAGDATVAAFCAAGDEEEADGNFDFVTLKLVAQQKAPTADPATPVVKKPAFTG